MKDCRKTIIIMLFCLIVNISIISNSTYCVAQTVIELATVEPDVTIIGSTSSSTIDLAVFLDFDDSGYLDLFIYDGAYQDQYGGECLFGFLDFAQNHHGTSIDLADYTHDITIVGDPDMNYRLGYSMTSGDWNDDGVSDLAFGDTGASTSGEFNGGAVFVLFGSEQRHSGDVIDLSQDLPDIFIYSSDLTEMPRIGYDVLALDINDDGVEDLAVGAQLGPNEQGIDTGAVYVVYGSDGYSSPIEIDINQGQQDITFQGKEGADWFGQSLAAGDVNGDQVDDLVVGAGKAWRGGSRYGAMYAFFGSGSFPPHYSVDLSEDEADITVVGNQHMDYFGQYISSGDFNGDGLSDMCGGQYGFEDSEEYFTRGAAYVIWGRNGFPAGTLIDLRTEMADITFIGEELDNYALGLWTSSGDLNNDGMDELCLSSANTSESNLDVPGGHSIFIGNETYPPNHTVELTNAYPTLRYMGIDDGDVNTGYIFSSIVDIDGNDIGDLVLGHGLADRPEANSCGEIYIYYSDGQPINRPPQVLAGPGPNEINPPELRMWIPMYSSAGWSESFSPFSIRGFGLNPAAGDLNGDGYDKILVGPGPGPEHPPIVLTLDSAGDTLWQFQAYGDPPRHALPAPTTKSST